MIPGARYHARRFWIALSATAVAGLAVRIAWTLTHGLIQNGLLVDQNFYHLAANSLAAGRGYSGYIGGGPSASKPPLYSLLLAVPSKLGHASVMTHRMVGALLGAIAIVAVGLLARRIAGDRVAIIAALLVAAAPQLWILNSQMLSENLYGPLLLAGLLLASGAYERPNLRRTVLLGAVIGLAILTRPEALVIGVLIAALLLRKFRKAALVPVAAGVLGCLVLLTPWMLRNLITFDRPVLISTQSAFNFGGANCAAAYYGTDTGNWRFSCLPPRTSDESRWGAEARAQGLNYARDHLERLPVVALARIARTWGIFHPRSSAGGGSEPGWTEPIAAWFLLALGSAGLVAAWKRRIRIWILLVPLITVTIASIAQFGVLRYRYSADLMLFVFAGIVLDTWVERRGRGRQRLRTATASR